MQGNRNAPQRNTTAKVHRAINRVDNPAVARIGAFDDARFFGADGMCRECGTQPIDNELFTRYIGDSHNVFNSLVADIAKVVLEFKAKVARLTGKFLCDIQKVFCIHFFLLLVRAAAEANSRRFVERCCFAIMEFFTRQEHDFFA